MAKLAETYACVPSTERGRGILVSGDPKSNRILYCNGRSVIILNLDNPLDISIYGEHAYQATVARFSPNGEWIASADVSGTVRIWGTRNEFVLKNEFRVLTGRIDDLQWSADGMRIVASGDGKGKAFVRAFMWDSGSNVGEFDGHSRRVLSCTFKPTRPFRIATCGEDFLVNFYEGPPFKFKHSHRDHSNFVNCIRFSPDGNKLISVSSDKTGIIYDGKTGEKIGELSSEDGHKGSIYSVSWSADSKQVLTVSADKSAKVWDISEEGNGKVNKTLTCPGSGGVDDMLVGCLWQNDHLVTVSLGGAINLFSACNLDKTPVLLSGHMKNITSLAVLQSNPKVILSSSYEGLIVKWIQGIGYSGKLGRKESSQIKCFAAVEGEIITSGFDNKVISIASEHIDDVAASIKNLEITDENIRLYLQNVDWNYFASIYIKGHSGAECEARWLNYEDPLINNNPWTHEEDKILRMIVQERGLNDCIDIAVSLGTNRTPFQCLTRYQRSLNPWIMKREWTKDEDAQLCAAVEVIGEGKWQTVASTLEGRTGTQCSNRWKKSLHPAKQRRGKWDPDEDIRLKIAVMILGPKTWRRIACFVPGRTDVQCRERWFNSLNPSLKMSAWTEDEDKRLLEAVEVHKYAWTKVAQCVPPRTDSQCLRRWEALCPDEKPKRQAVRKIKRLALTSNFVDRESERPNLRPEDFVPLLMLNSAADCEKLISSTKSKKKSCEISKEPRLRKPRKNAKTRLNEVSDIASAEVSDPNAESSLLMVEHVPTSDMLPEQQLISSEPSACQPSLSVSQTVDGANTENSSIKKKQGTKRKAAANENAPKANLNSANRLKRCAEPSAGQSSPLQSQAIDKSPAEILIIKEKRCPKRKAATEKSAPITSPQKSKRVKKGPEQYQTPQSINGNAEETYEQNITSVNKERAANQHDAFLNHLPVEQVRTEMAGNDNAHLLNTQTLEFDTVGLHEELDRLLSLNLPWEDSE